VFSRHEIPDKFFVETNGNSRELLVIDRLTQEITLVENRNQIPPVAKSRPICGIIGTIRLLAGNYLVVITKSSKAGQINGQDIWRVEETDVISFSRTLLHLNEEQVNSNLL
jgi:phosphatidylinositol 4-phosphatase